MPSEAQVQAFFGACLWAVSGFYTLSLFLTLAGNDPWRSTMAFLWAVGLEGSKILLWRKGGWRPRCIALGLVLLSIFSAVYITYHNLELARDAAKQASLEKVHASLVWTNTDTDLKQARVKVQGYTDRGAGLGEAYVTGFDRNDKAVSTAEARVAELEGKLESIEKEGVPRGDPSLLELVVSLVLAVLSEFAALVLSGQASTKSVQPVAQPAAVAPMAVTPSLYLSTAQRGAMHGRLWGRTKVAEMLGVSERQVRKAYDELVAKRIIKPGKAPALAGGGR